LFYFEIATVFYENFAMTVMMIWDAYFFKLKRIFISKF